MRFVKIFALTSLLFVIPIFSLKAENSNQPKNTSTNFEIDQSIIDQNTKTSQINTNEFGQKSIDEKTKPAKTSRFLLMSRLINHFLTNGVPKTTLYLILSYPFIAFIIAFSRQVIGISTFGVYTPTVVSLSFLILGINFGLITFFIVVAISYIIRKIFSKIEILHVPRISLLLSLISLSFLGVIAFILYIGSPIVIAIAIFPMLVMSTISEKFISAQSEEGLKYALFGAVETIGISIIAYLIVALPMFMNLILRLPELVIVPLIGDIMLGKFTGLRLSEYFRFRSLIMDSSEEE